MTDYLSTDPNAGAETSKYLSTDPNAVDITNPEQMAASGPGAPGNAPLPKLPDVRSPGESNEAFRLKQKLGPEETQKQATPMLNAAQDVGIAGALITPGLGAASIPEMLPAIARTAGGGFVGSEVGGRYGGTPGRIAGGLIGSGLGYKFPDVTEGLANRIVGEENVPMWMKSPQSVGRMVEGAQDEMYNEKGDALINRGKAQAKLDAPPKLGKSTVLQMAAPEREAAIPRAGAPTPAEEFAGRQAQARIAPPEPEEGGIAAPYGRGGESQIGSNAPERQVQTIMQKNIVTPEEQSFVERSLGPNARMRPGEGITDWRARVTGLMKAARGRTK